ncbi:hypothetical protein [Pyrobaculum sp.]
MERRSSIYMPTMRRYALGAVEGVQRGQQEVAGREPGGIRGDKAKTA